MTYGGTNWGNLGYQGGDSSYDYGASINEYRQVWREKYSEQKLQANFFKVSPAYLTSKAGNSTNGTYADTTAVNTTPLVGQNRTNFYIVRQANWTSTTPLSYRITFNTSEGAVTLPQLGSQLSLLGRDAKIMVTDYDLGGINLVYSTADIFTWARSLSGKTVLVVYGTEGETHELAVPASLGRPSVSSGANVTTERIGSTWVAHWSVTKSQQVLHFNSANLEIRMLWRNDAYNYWVLELPGAAPIGNYSSPSKSSVVVKAGYLLRTASIDGNTLSLTGDFNTTTNVQVVFDPTDRVDSLVINGFQLRTTQSRLGELSGTMTYQPPSLKLPDLAKASWRAINSLPEIQTNYDDSLWTDANHLNSTNNQLPVFTPTVLFASDYGYHHGSLLYRGHFTANGLESYLYLNVSGGWGFGYSVYLNNTFLGSWIGNDIDATNNQTFSIPTNLTSGLPYVITLLQDHMGQDEEGPGTDAVKFPMGILNYKLAGHPASDLLWKLTGNLGGESYVDKARGPKNEGAMYAERQGYHLPAPPSYKWETSNPITQGLTGPGVAFYSTSFELDIPESYDIPLGFSFSNNTDSRGAYRAQLFVNGYQFGKFVPHLGPEFVFPVPEGVLNHAGTNYLGITLWAMEEQGASLGGLSLRPEMAIITSFKRPSLSPQPAWEFRADAY
ncbi:beta-galactosidase, domain 2-domain-containing protein [Xylariales sp. PMI_506]|nr:beta-galactosidase, domain 2-domain-containing protein [Xylariales sp. PMI_506]